MYNNRCRYHKNTIIFQITLLLVGIADCSLLVLLLVIAGTMRSLHSHLRGFSCPDIDAMILLLLITQIHYELRFYKCAWHYVPQIPLVIVSYMHEVFKHYTPNINEVNYHMISCQTICHVVTSTSTSCNTCGSVIGKSADHSWNVLITISYNNLHY